MASMVEQLEEQPPAKKPRIDNPEEKEEIANANESNLPKSTGKIEHEVSETPTITTLDLAPARRRLPLEMNCEMYKFLKFSIQRKFIWGMGRGIYAMFGQKLLKKTKRVRKTGNRWDNTNTTATVAANSLSARNNTYKWQMIYAEKGFPISVPHCRVDQFPGTLCYYYEVKGDLCYLGLSDGAIPDPEDHNYSWIGICSHSYGIPIGHLCHRCWLAGTEHYFELPEEAIRPEMTQFENVFGCGLVLDPDNNLAIFFTLNGQVLCRKIPISPTVDCLFPAVRIWEESSVEANFGDDPAKPFEYDINNCPGLELNCI